jgi:predicted nucleic acid-binding protein
MSASAWYLDTSAFVKQVRREPESAALRKWLDGDREIVSSDLLRTEARRTVLGESRQLLLRCEELLEAITLIRLTPELFDVAGRLEPRGMRSLDALHLAAALALGEDLAGIVAYDRRLLAAAAALEIEAVSPGSASARAR